MSADWLTTEAASLPSAALLRAVAAEKFGALAQHPGLSALIRTARRPAHSEHLKEWRRAMAEDLLLASILGAKLSRAALRPFLDVPPLHTSTQTLEQLHGRRTAVAVIPLDGGDHAPFCAHLWLIEDPRAPRGTLPGWQSLPAACEIHGSRFAVHAVYARQPASDIAGESYQLALWLVERALAENDHAAIQTLALTWIISGKNNDPHVGTVEIGNKLGLAINRRWLLPKATKASIRSRAPRFTPPAGVDFAETLTSA